MPSGQPTTASDSPAADAWQEIEQALDELADLARRRVTPDEFHGKLLQRLTGLLDAVGGAVWSLDDGEGAIASALHLDQALGGDAQELARQHRLVETVERSGAARLVPPAYRDAELANATPWLVALSPVAAPGQRLCVQLFLRPDGRPSVEEGYLRLVRTACDLAEEYHRARSLDELQRREQQQSGLLEFVQHAHAHLELDACAAAIANEGRRLLSCDRVSVLPVRGAKPRLAAISGVESFDRRSDVLQAMEQAAARVAAAGEPVWHPSEAELPPQLADSLDALVDASHVRGLAIVPMIVGEADDDERTVGILVVEQFRMEIDATLQQRILALGHTGAPALGNALAVARIPFRGPLVRAATFLGLSQGVRSPAAIAALLILAAAAALVLIPAELKIEARGQALPVERRQLFAPTDAIVVEVARGDGASVTKDDVVLQLHSPSLDIAHGELVGKQRTAQEDLLAAETESLRNELNPETSQSRGQLTARVEQLKESLRGIEAQLAVVRAQQAELTVRSPLSGVVVSWDTAQQLAGRPVKRGDSLLTVADLSGPWELVLEVPDWRAGHVLRAANQSTALPVSFQLGTDPSARRLGQVTSISPANELSAEGAPVVRVTAEFDTTQAGQRRPGTSVVARIHCGKTSLGYVWLHELWEAARSRLFL